MIDKETIDKIRDTADIVDVVSDFVSLRRRGANYIGLCPFHNEKTPSFSVSPSRQFCHCFSCGKGGSPIGFIMEHEQMTYPEALRYLAKKYNIEIHETGMSDEARAARDERESMLVLNEYAADYFEKQLHDTEEGRDIGLAYFQERGFSIETIRKFHLGYSPDRRSAFYDTAKSAGYNRRYIIDTGLCIDDQKGGGFDRFRGRVMFPVFNIAGKVIAFGGRTLKGDKAKYLNSPESTVYVKNRELYGLFQAKRAIGKADRCFLVEGYTDVISMHQAGIENVVASSGTSLTAGQIKMIQRFTNNVTVLYDGDSAGIHASLRGIDMLLEQGLNVRVLLLPDGEDPDSFARSHSATEFNDYIAQNESDFISFKIKTLLEGTSNDPVRQATVIGDVVKSIAVIPNPITRDQYLKLCSRQTGTNVSILQQELAKYQRALQNEHAKQREREEMQRRREAQQADGNQQAGHDGQDAPIGTQKQSATLQNTQRQLAERELIRYVAKFGMCFFCNTVWDESQEEVPTCVVEYVQSEFDAAGLSFLNPVYQKIFEFAIGQINDFYIELQHREQERTRRDNETFDRDVVHLDIRGEGPEGIQKKEQELMDSIRAQSQKEIDDFREGYLERLLLSMGDSEVMNVAQSLVIDKHRLSKIYTENATLLPERERLDTIVDEAVINLKNTILETERQDILNKMKSDTLSADQIMEMQRRIIEIDQERMNYAKLTGERVVRPVAR